MAPSPVEASDSDSAEEGFNYYSGAAKRFKKTKAKTFQTGIVKLVSSPDPKHAKLAKKAPSPERIELDSSDEELFRNVNDTKETEDSNLDQSITLNKYHQVETLEDVEQYVALSPDIAVYDNYQRPHSSASVNIENDDITFDDDPLNCGPNNSLDMAKALDENEKVVVKVRFIHEKVWRIEITGSEYFKSIIHQLAEKTEVEENKIKLYHNDKLVDPYDTLQTVPLRITDILDAVVAEDDEEAAPNDATGMLELKIQGQDKGTVVIVAIRPQDPMKVLMQKYADATDNDVSQLAFNFDGEQLSPEDTPEMLDLEGGECIDVHIRR